MSVFTRSASCFKMHHRRAAAVMHFLVLCIARLPARDGTFISLALTMATFNCSPADAAGIGKAIAQKLAGQQLNVVLVALQDQLLDATHEELSTLHPDVSFRKACVSWAATPASTELLSAL